MTDRYDELRVSPDPARAEDLRRLLHAQIERGSPNAPSEPGDWFVPVKEMHMSEVESPDDGHTNRWRLPAVAAAVVIVLGAAGIAVAVSNTTADDDGVPQAPATTVTASTTVTPSTTTGFFAGGGDGIPVTYIVPDGWEPFGGGWAVINSDDSAGVNFFDIADLYSDGCQWTVVDPPVGPTVDDLVAAWADLPGFAPTPAVDVTVDGYAGQQIEFTVPNYDVAECEEGKFGLWTEDGQVGTSPTFWAQSPAQRNRQMILDVDGTRLVITANSSPDASPEDLAVMDQILASIQIG